MNKTVKRSLAMLLAMLMLVSAFAACGSDSGSSAPSSSESSSSDSSVSSEDTSSEEGEDASEPEEGTTGAWTAPQEFDNENDDYDAISEYFYDFNLGEFYELYQAATQEVDDINKRYALEALGEAKLLASGVMQPTTSNGGQYAFGRIAPGSTTTNGWGSDNERYQYAIVTEQIIKSEDREALKKLLLEKKGTGEYAAAAKEYLTGKGYTLKDSYNVSFTSMPSTWDMMNTSRAADTVPVLGTMDSLLFFDGENREVPALAESWEVSEDGLTWTFHIRKGVKWVDSQGREVADVIADDWVAGLQHVCDSGSGLSELFIGVLENIQPYLTGEDTDFSKVGIEAVDDHTLVYHLEKKIPYFTSMLHYGISLPLSRSYYTSQGGKFGDEYDTEAETYQYGLDPDHIAYCGPFLITSAVENNSITYKANPTYWDAANVTIKSMQRLYNDNSDVTKGYNDLLAGTIDQQGINASTVETAKTEMAADKAPGWGTEGKSVFDDFSYVTSNGSTSYMNFMNVNRATWNNVRNETEVLSTQTEEEATRTHIALNNTHFRRALAMSVDRNTWNAQAVGEELATLSLRNSYTPATFVSLTADTTVEINGEEVTFPAGTDYGEIMQAQLDADGVKITVYKLDESAENGRGTGDGFDGWYSEANAQEELAIAIEELAGAGVTVDESNPIQVDLPFLSSNTIYTNKANTYKQSVEKALGGKVIVNLVECVNSDEWYYAGYYTERGYESNYDLYDLSGWSPDFMDPCSYIDTFLPDYNGYMTKCIGVY
ncbi:ABC transporter substrate-binding protein [Acutalibacter caecimuris]|uniref:ABC transporter substrate-binding protein n=1 Tax=Acutalibacter caecimuris TaxID=3093657 RepID=UPI002AC9BDF5|nr:ABC transporter substrate-binding protein [Acutalibacter sp. M00118]